MKPYDKQLILKAYNDGCKIKQIAVLWNYTYQYVYNIIRLEVIKNGEE